ncbi:MAG: hypothetical protein IPM17_15520, partial [Verrucomicrobia bacterium]|nr:hypothetical protein [Verrucomicrobiota bacterium]
MHQDLWVKAAAFAVAGKTGVVVTADALIIPREVGDLARRQLAEARGLSREAVYFSATHTHASLGGWEKASSPKRLRRIRAGVRQWFARQLTTAAVAAVDDLAPASLDHGRF